MKSCRLFDANSPHACLLLLAALAIAACSPDKPPPARTGAAPVERRGPTVRYGELPPELSPYAKAIERSRLGYIGITLRQPDALMPWNSRLGGTAYLPKGQAHPVGPDGKPLALLAQLNFSEMPALQGYPARGIVQFFIAGSQSNAHVYGMLSDDTKPFDEERYFASLSRQRWFRVVYHPQVLQDREKLQDAPAPSPEMMLPMTGTAALGFETGIEPVSAYDYRFERFLGKPAAAFFAQFGAREEAVANNYIAFSDKPVVAKVGGYSNPTQRDPRLTRPDQDWVVLLELQGGALDNGFYMEWGDSGMGAFYIRRDDLARQDFSNVVYYWDNH